jgi:glycosyltransferase involved in cell wall biosynthesis
LKVLDSRALPELSWEGSCTVWQAARRLVNAWMDQIANHELGRDLRYLGLNLVSLFDEHVLAKFAYPALTTCAQLDLAVHSGCQSIVLWDGNSVPCRTIRAYALARSIPFVVRTDWPKTLHPYSRAESLALAHHLLKVFLDARIRWQNRSISRARNAGFNVLALLGSGIYAASALPVLERIRDSGRVLLIPLDHKVDRFLAQQSWSSIILSDYMPEPRRPIVHRARRDLQRAVQMLLKQTDLWSLFRVDRVDLTQVARPIIQTLLQVRLPMALPVLEGLQAIIQRQRPQLILSVPDRQWRAKAAIEFGRREHIPSLTIQAAVISRHPRYDMIVADRVAVIGDLSRRLWEEHGIPAEKLVVTGAPRFDVKYRLDPGAPERIRAALGVPSGKPIITFATQPLPATVVERNTKNVVRAAKRFPDHQLVFKVHPREEPARYRRLLGKLEVDKIIITQDVDLNALLQASALVVTGFSTVALEAMAYDRPVLIVNLTGEPDPVDYVSSGAAAGAYTPEDVVKQMVLLLTDAQVNATLVEGRRKYVVDQLYRVDGQATRRVVELIQDMIGTNILLSGVVQ